MHWSKGRVFSAVIAAMFVAGVGLGMSCSKRSGDIAAVANPEYVQPIGHVQGKVVDQCSDLSLEDVEVSIAIKGKVKSVTTDNNGIFAFQNLPVNYGVYSGGECYVVVANFEKYNKKQADAVKKWNKKDENADDQKTARPYPDTVEGKVCLHYEWIDSAMSDGVVTYTGSGAATVVDGLTGGVILYASKPVGTVVGEAFWGKDKTPASGVLLNLYGENPLGDNALEGQAVVGADGTYQFSMVHECQSYFIAPAKPCFDLASSGYTGDYFEVLATQLSDPEGDLALTNIKCIELNAIPCVDNQAPCLIASNPKEKMDIANAGQAITLTFSELMDENLPVMEEVEILFAGYKALIPPSVGFDYAWSTAVVNMEGYPTAQTVSVLTLTPTSDLMLGMKYEISLTGGTLSYTFQDLAGNAYAQNSVVCNSKDVTNGDSKISFTTNYGGTCPTVTNLAQVANTANAVNQHDFTGWEGGWLDKDAVLAGLQAPVLNTNYWDPANNDLTTEYTTNQAVLSWTAPGTVTAPVRVKGYRLYARVNPMDVWTRVADETALGSYNGYWPAKTAFTTVNLTDINEALASASIETMTSTNWGYDKTGSAAQTVELAVTTVNADGYECPEITSANSITLEDNTIPMIVRNNAFAINALSRDKIDTAYFSAAGPIIYDTVKLSNLVYPDNTLGSWDPGLMACNYGHLPLAIPILEDVDPTTLSGVTFVNTSATELGICQLTFCTGWYIEPNDAFDGELVQTLGPKLVSSKGKNYIVMVWNNAYKLDTGDRLVIPGVRDIAGNIVPAYTTSTGVGGGWVHVVDDIPPMMKSVTINGTDNTITVTTTEKIAYDVANPVNITRFLRDAGNAEELAGLGDGASGLAGVMANPSGQPKLRDANRDNVADADAFSVVQSTTDDQSTITIKLDDVSYIQRYDRIKFNNLEDEAWTGAGMVANQSNDNGTAAYWYRTGLGAYAPGTDGIGTTNGIVDTIAPRLSERTWTAGAWHSGNEPLCTAPAPGPNATFNCAITFTEDVYNVAGSTADTNEVDNTANYQVRIRDCGADAVCGGAGAADDSLVQAQIMSITGSANGATINCQTPSGAPAGRVHEVVSPDSLITVSNLRDVVGNVVTVIGPNTMSGNNQYIYKAAVLGPPAIPAHWERRNSQ